MLAAWLLLPGIAPLSAAVPVAIDHAADDGFRGSALRPLSYGGAPQRLASAGALVIPLAAAPERPRLDLVATLGSQDSFPRMLQRAGVSADDAAHAAALVANAVPLGQLAPGTHVAITLGQRSDASAPRPLEALSLRARFDLDLAVERRGGTLTLGSRAIAVDATPLRIRGIVGSSLYRSARAAGAPPSAIQDYLRALDEHSALDGIDPSDEFDFVLSYRRAAGGEAQPGDLLYAGLDRGGKPRTELVRWGKDGQLADALADVTAPAVQQEESIGLGAPVAGHVTSGFGLRRHPILGYVRMHAGIDFAAAAGSPIYAVSDGQVSYAGWHGGHGNYVRLEHGGGLATGYGHMSRIAVSPRRTRRPWARDRLRRLDRPLDRSAPPLRTAARRPPDQPRHRALHDARAPGEHGAAFERTGSGAGKTGAIAGDRAGCGAGAAWGTSSGDDEVTRASGGQGLPPLHPITGLVAHRRSSSARREAAIKPAVPGRCATCPRRTSLDGNGFQGW